MQSKVYRARERIDAELERRGIAIDCPMEPPFDKSDAEAKADNRGGSDDKSR